MCLCVCNTMRKYKSYLNLRCENTNGLSSIKLLKRCCTLLRSMIWLKLIFIRLHYDQSSGIRVNQMRNYLTIQGEGNAGVTLIGSYTWILLVVLFCSNRRPLFGDNDRVAIVTIESLTFFSVQESLSDAALLCITNRAKYV